MAEGHNDSGGGFFAGLLMGGIVGFFAGVLFAPKSGEELRAVLSERGQEWRDKADELAAAARERLATASTESDSAGGRRPGSPFDDLDLDDEDL